MENPGTEPGQTNKGGGHDEKAVLCVVSKQIMEGVMNRIMSMMSGLVVVALVAANVAAAKTISFSNSKGGSVGNTQAGASYALNGQAYANDASSVNNAYVRLWGNATAKLLGKSGQLAGLDAKVGSTKNSGTLNVMVKACGFNVVNQNESFATGKTKTYSKTYSSTFLDAKATFWVSVVPVTFSGKVGGGASMNLTYFIGPLRADVSGGPKAWGSTSAKAGIEIGGYTLAAVGATAKLMETYLRSTVGIGFLAGQKKGGVYCDINPLNANFWFQILKFKKYSIAEWSAPSQSYTIIAIN